jgi:uncharacterized protein (DUF169 family)
MIHLSLLKSDCERSSPKWASLQKKIPDMDKHEIAARSGSYSAAARTLTSSLALRQQPVAIAFSESVPSGLASHQGRVPAGCRFWQDGISSAFATKAADHNLCSIGVYTHNLEPSASMKSDLHDALKVFSDLGYVREEDLPHIPVLRQRPHHVVYGPLAETSLPPDVILLFVNANQTLILAEATEQVEGQLAPAMGRPACAVVPAVMNSGRAALSLGCCGARAYLDVMTDDVAVFAIPSAKLEAYTARIHALSQANGLLSKFHDRRRRDVEGGESPSVSESLGRM